VPGGGIILGHTAESLYEYLGTRDIPIEFPQQGEEFGPFHMVIEAKHKGKRAIIDLTAYQITEASQGRIQLPPYGLVYYGEGWPSDQLRDGSQVSYMDSPHPPSMADEYKYRNSGLTGDLVVLMKLAFKCDLDPTLFNLAMKRNAKLLYPNGLGKIG
jgi:hypothetical protein